MATLLKFRTSVSFRFSVICAGRKGVSISCSWYSDQVRIQDIHPAAAAVTVTVHRRGRGGGTWIGPSILDRSFC